MSKSQNITSEQLTEQWKKGELPSRDDDHCWLAYYIKHKDGYIHADSLWRGHWGTADRNSIKEVLAPVPSYEKWQAELEENAQLKELLEWCRDELFEIYSNEVSHPEDVPIIKKLNEVVK